MPQVTLEYTANVGSSVPFRELAAELHQLLIRVAEAAPLACKSRAYRADDYFIGDGAPQYGFVHLRIGLLTGRTPEAVQEVQQQAMALLQKYIPPPAGLSIRYTVETYDIRLETYLRSP